MPFTPDEKRDLPQIISTPRFATYLQATNNDISNALSLYQWNLQVSAAFIVPLQVCEVATRNGVAVALENLYGQNWYVSQGFLKSFSQKQTTYYSPYHDLKNTTKKLSKRGALTAGKIVAELKFAFWETMLTKKHDQRLWVPYFSDAFPHADLTISVFVARKKANDHLEKVRRLRNRIAHHEPIFIRNIQEEYDQILEIIRWRSPVSADWVEKVQDVTALNQRKPINPAP